MRKLSKLVILSSLQERKVKYVRARYGFRIEKPPFSSMNGAVRS
jgi:hypothetical protein